MIFIIVICKSVTCAVLELMLNPTLSNSEHESDDELQIVHEP